MSVQEISISTVAALSPAIPIEKEFWNLNLKWILSEK
jgi:hypothetical protein